MNTIDTILNWNSLLTEGQVKKRLTHKVINRITNSVTNFDFKDLPKRYNDIARRAVGTKKGRADILSAGATKRIQGQAVKNGEASPEELAHRNKEFVRTGKDPHRS